jgi:hypothetical protein
MKKITTLLIGLAFSLVILNSQEAPPQAFSFKATIVNKSGAIIANKTVGLQISISKNSIDVGAIIFTETFMPKTNEYGQVDIMIGKGTVVSGDFPTIPWSSGEFYLHIAVDVKGGTAYQPMSVTQLLSVPYALYAKSAGGLSDASIALWKINGENTYWNLGKVGIGTKTPGAKLTIDNIGGISEFGKGALYIADQNQYFDFNCGLMFRGTGVDWSSRFTANNQMKNNGEILGIYKIETNPGDTRLLDPPQGVIAVFRNNGNVGIGTTNPQAKLHINGNLKLEPQATPPQGTLGDLYTGTNGKLYFHNGSGWKEVQLVN